MRLKAWSSTVMAFCMMAANGAAQNPEAEIERLKAELEQLRAENKILKAEVSRLKGQDGDSVRGNPPPHAVLLTPEAGVGEDAGKIVFGWAARGKHVADRPVSLYWAEKANGPWKLIADGLAKEGTYAWGRPSGVPDWVYLRLKAVNSTGEVALADTFRRIYLNLEPKRER